MNCVAAEFEQNFEQVECGTCPATILSQKSIHHKIFANLYFPKRLQDMSSRRLQDVFIVKIFRLLRHLQGLFARRLGDKQNVSWDICIYLGLLTNLNQHLTNLYLTNLYFTNLRRIQNALIGGDYMISTFWDEISTRPVATDYTLRLHIEINFPLTRRDSFPPGICLDLHALAVYKFGVLKHLAHWDVINPRY